MNRSQLQESFENYKACMDGAEKEAFLLGQQKGIASLSAEEAKAEIKAIADEAKEMARKANTHSIGQKSA